MGSHPYGRRCCLWAAPHEIAVSPRRGATPAGGSPGRGAAPCGLTACSRHLRPGRGRLPLVVAPWIAGPTATATAGGLPLQGAWPQSAAPLQGGLSCSRPPPCRCPVDPTMGLAVAVQGRSYIPVFQIQIEKMKEIKRPLL
ncbi:hypothetical protein BHM03_00054758 [Ensete ventricosum]|nr:hypothetical protein BHM03_00054758 [Ensete ventricosum]